MVESVKISVKSLTALCLCFLFQEKQWKWKRKADQKEKCLKNLKDEKRYAKHSQNSMFLYYLILCHVLPFIDDNVLTFLSFFVQARQLHVSTDDYEVKMHLRQLGEPICKWINYNVCLYLNKINILLAVRIR